jgi:Tol biopolymer transport system component
MWHRTGRLNARRGLRALFVLAVLAGLLNGAGPSKAVVGQGANGLIAVEADIPGGQLGDGALVALNPASGVRTTLEGSGAADNEPEVSPDGTKVAFDNAGNIFFADFPTGKNRVQVTSAGGFGSASGCGGPSWSPDSTRLVFCSATGIVIANASANAPTTQLTQSNAGDSDPDFDPTGTIVLFDNPVEGIVRLAADNTGGRFVLNNTTGGPQGDDHPRVAQGGALVYFDVTGGPDPGIHSMPWPNGGTRVKLQGTTSVDEDPSPSPDGIKLAFQGSGGGIFTLNTDNSGGRVAIPGTQNGDINPSWGISAAVPPPSGVNGPIVVESGRFNQPGAGPLVIINPVNGARIAIAGTSGADNHPEVSPSQSKIAFDSNGNIVVEDYPAGTNRLLVTTSGGASTPSWSPDSGTLVFACASGLCTAPVTANAQVTLLIGTAAGDTDPSFSPDAQLIVFDNPASGIVRVNANGTGGRTVLTDTAGGGAPDDHPRIAPNSSVVYFDAASVPGGVTSLAWPNGGNRTRVTGTQAGDDNPAISPDGTKVVFSGGVPPSVSTLNVDGSGGRTVTEGTQSGDIFANWTKSGTTLPECPGHNGDSRADVIGTNGDDVLVGPQGAIVCGLDGNDILKSPGGSLLEGGVGIDVLCARQGVPGDTLDGGPGIDRARFDDGEAVVNVERWASATLCTG